MKKFKESKMQRAFLKCYQGLFDLLSENYDFHPLMDEMDEIIRISEETKVKLKKWEDKYLK